MTDFLGLILKLISTQQVAGDQTPVPSFCGELDLKYILLSIGQLIVSIIP